MPICWCIFPEELLPSSSSTVHLYYFIVLVLRSISFALSLAASTFLSTPYAMGFLHPFHFHLIGVLVLEGHSTNSLKTRIHPALSFDGKVQLPTFKVSWYRCSSLPLYWVILSGFHCSFLLLLSSFSWDLTTFYSVVLSYFSFSFVCLLWDFAFIHHALRYQITLRYCFELVAIYIENN